MNARERAKFVQEGVATVREREAAMIDDGHHGQPPGFDSIAEACAYYTHIARASDVDEVAFIEIILTTLDLSREALEEAADVLGKLKYGDVARMMRRLARRAQSRPPAWPDQRMAERWKHRLH